MDPLWIALTAVGAVALGFVAFRTFLLQIGGNDVLFGRKRLELREAPGFVAGEQEVRISVDVSNRGGVDTVDQVVEALVDGEVVAASAPVDVARGQTGHVRLSIPRRFVQDVEGERPL